VHTLPSKKVCINPKFAHFQRKLVSDYAHKLWLQNFAVLEISKTYNKEKLIYEKKQHCFHKQFSCFKLKKNVCLTILHEGRCFKSQNKFHCRQRNQWLLLKLKMFKSRNVNSVSRKSEINMWFISDIRKEVVGSVIDQLKGKLSDVIC